MKIKRNIQAMLTGSFMLFACSNSQVVSGFDYSRLITLDAESLCESGIEDAYDDVKPSLAKIIKPQEITRVHKKNDDYIIKFNGRNFPVYIYETDKSVEGCWQNAKNIFFHIVNEQLKNSDKKFYAFYGGNDLFGGFLTPTDVNLIKANNPNSEYEWPYLPTYTETIK